MLSRASGSSSRSQRWWFSPPPRYSATTATARSSASTIKIAVLSDCQGAFGSFDNQDMAGVVTAMAQFAGAKAKNKNKPRDGWTGGSINGHPLKLVGVGCSNDRADTAIKETKRLMEQLGADILIGPLSGDESIAVANYAKQHPNEDVRGRFRRRAGHDAEGPGPELLPVQR